jgi:hypothetical protein
LPLPFQAPVDLIGDGLFSGALCPNKCQHRTAEPLHVVPPIGICVDVAHLGPHGRQAVGFTDGFAAQCRVGLPQLPLGFAQEGEGVYPFLDY